MQFEGSSWRSRNLQHVGGEQQLADVPLVDLDAARVREAHDELHGAQSYVLDGDPVRLRLAQVAREHGPEVRNGGRKHHSVRLDDAFAGRVDLDVAQLAVAPQGLERGQGLARVRRALGLVFPVAGGPRRQRRRPRGVVAVSAAVRTSRPHAEAAVAATPHGPRSAYTASSFAVTLACRTHARRLLLLLSVHSRPRATAGGRREAASPVRDSVLVIPRTITKNPLVPASSRVQSFSVTGAPCRSFPFTQPSTFADGASSLSPKLPSSHTPCDVGVSPLSSRVSDASPWRAR